jgi:hypothetical protein
LDQYNILETKFGVKILEIDKLSISGFLPRGNEGGSIHPGRVEDLHGSCGGVINFGQIQDDMFQMHFCQIFVSLNIYY